MKKTYRFYVIRISINYPLSKRFRTDEEYRTYLDNIINKVKIVKITESANAEKLFETYKLIKNPPKIKIANKGKTMVETNVYYFVECMYINNKLQSHTILKSKYPSRLESEQIEIKRRYI